VRDDLAGSPWPIPAAVGAEVGLVVRTVDGELVANQCELVPPARLRAARDEGWPRGILRVGARRLVPGGRSVRVELACHGRCDGAVTLRAPDGRALARRRISLRTPLTRLRLGLSRTARRRLARHGQIPARVTVHLEPARRVDVHNATVVLQRRRG
jgi:hypothetical protein